MIIYHALIRIIPQAVKIKMHFRNEQNREKRSFCPQGEYVSNGVADVYILTHLTQ